jgi:glycosyltransferase involved in cell wall biosynthesis
MVRLLALVHKPPGVSPGQRFRLEQWRPHLESNHDISIDFSAFESAGLTDVMYRVGHRLEKAGRLLLDTWRRRKILALARNYDGVVVYREASALGPAIYERLLEGSRIPIIYDFDDAIWLPTVGSVNGPFRHLRFAGKTAAICRLASAVSVGNQYLAEWAQKHNPRVFVVPTSISLQHYSLRAQPPADAPLVVGWIGSHSTLVHLELLREPLRRLGLHRRFRLRIVCDRPPVREFAGPETEFIPWSRDGEVDAIAGMHIGVMPLTNDAAARGKCACKALQYMAVGRPAVVSPVGINTDIIQHHQNGLLAANDDEWFEALNSLAGSSLLRNQLGQAGRKTVEDGFSSEQSAAAFAEVVRFALSSQSRRS